jgi:hypothetical protein
MGAAARVAAMPTGMVTGERCRFIERSGMIKPLALRAISSEGGRVDHPRLGADTLRRGSPVR